LDPELLDSASAGRHPLIPALQIAQQSYRHLRQHVRDYTCVFVRRERMEGQLGPHEYMLAKVRHQGQGFAGQATPFGVYLKFLKPASVAGREVLYVQGRYDDRLVVRNGGKRMAYVVTELRPNSDLAMRDNRYPLTEFGIENLVRRLIQVAQEDIESNAPCEVKIYRQAKIDGRPTMGIQVRHTQQREGMRFYLARIFWDRELQVPVLFESYDWPPQPGGNPPLLEQYAYRNLRLNVGLSDTDFDRDNPDYRLRREGR
jgi:hypothetical protein